VVKFTLNYFLSKILWIFKLIFEIFVHYFLVFCYINKLLQVSLKNIKNKNWKNYDFACIIIHKEFQYNFSYFIYKRNLYNFSKFQSTINHLNQQLWYLPLQFHLSMKTHPFIYLYSIHLIILLKNMHVQFHKLHNSHLLHSL